MGARKDVHHDDGSDLETGLWRRLSAECIGTAVLVFVDAGGAILSLSSADLTSLARSIATGMTIVSMSFALSSISGAHFNPAVTASFALRRIFPWKYIPAYWGAQLIGACGAALLLRCLLGSGHGLGCTHPQGAVLPALAFETIFSAMLMGVILSTATKHRMLGTVAPLAAGSVIVLADLIARPVSGASFNPARSLGPALISGDIRSVWIYIVAPLFGALIAAGYISWLHPSRHAGEEEAACGDNHDT